jgi:quinol monooxygenase YgiN
MNTPLTVVARWQVRPEAVASVLALVAELRQRSLEEPGCRGYDVLQSPGAPDQVVLIESYVDWPAIEEHRRSKHYQELVVGRILPLLTTRRLDLLQPFQPPA